jgi:hypothetical protein
VLPGNVHSILGPQLSAEILGSKTLAHPDAAARLSDLESTKPPSSTDLATVVKAHPEHASRVYRALEEWGTLIDGKVPVLGADGQVHPVDEVVLVSPGTSEAPDIMGHIPHYEGEETSLHPSIVQDGKAVAWLKRQGLRVVNAQSVSNDLVRLLRTEPRTFSLDESVDAILFLIGQGESIAGVSLYSAKGMPEAAGNLFVPGSANDWAPLSSVGLLPGYESLNEAYLDQTRQGRRNVSSDRVLEALRGAGLHGFDEGHDASLTEVAAYAVFEERLSSGHNLARVTDRRRRGFDYQCVNHCTKVFEIKGMSDPSDIDLTESEVVAATQRGDDFILVCVFNLPESLERVRTKTIANPSKIAVPRGEAVIPKSRWLT